MRDDANERTLPLARFDCQRIIPAERTFPLEPDESVEFMIGNALREVGKPVLRKLVTEHCPDTPRRLAARSILSFIRRCGFDVLRVRPPAPSHSTPVSGNKEEGK